MSEDGPTSYLSPRLEARPVNGGRGVFARKPIRKGEILAVWGGRVVTAPRFYRLPPAQRQISVQVEETLYMVPAREGPAEWFNHACAPNAGMFGQCALVAMRDIAPGEEVRYDYAMSDGSPYDEFTCHCGAPRCRGRITGHDWQRPELWTRYAGYFSPYLQRRIDHLQRTAAATAQGDGFTREPEVR